MNMNIYEYENERKKAENWAQVSSIYMLEVRQCNLCKHAMLVMLRTLRSTLKVRERAGEAWLARTWASETVGVRQRAGAIEKLV